jgi:cytochrome c-type biogenesis protein CcmH
MTGMWWSFAALVLMAIVFMAFPWIFSKRRSNSECLEDQANVYLYQEHLGDLQQQFERQDIDQLQFAQLKLELERSLLIDNVSTSVETPLREGKYTKPWLLLVLSVVVAVASIAIYRDLGSSQDLEIQQLLHSADSLVDDNPELGRQMRSKALAKINQRLTQDPDNYYYLIDSARLYFDEKDYHNALRSYRRASMLSPDNVTLLEEMLQAAYMNSKGKFSPELRNITNRILQLQPHNLPVTGLSARLAMESGDYPLAIKQYQKILNVLPTEHDTAKSIQADIKFAQQTMSQQVSPVQGLTEPLPADEVTDNAGQGVGPVLRVNVGIADGVADGVADSGAMLFVIARKSGVKGGPPLAVKRLSLGSLPMQVTLDDSNTMLPGTSLGDATQLDLVARISQSGSPMKQSGDVQGRVQVDTPSGELVIDLIIDQVVP